MSVLPAEGPQRSPGNVCQKCHRLGVRPSVLEVEAREMMQARWDGNEPPGKTEMCLSEKHKHSTQVRGQKEGRKEGSLSENGSRLLLCRLLQY